MFVSLINISSFILAFKYKHNRRRREHIPKDSIVKQFKSDKHKTQKQRINEDREDKDKQCQQGHTNKTKEM